MLEHIEISNFKSIKNINIDLGRVNIFIGENGSGKSNILEAIAFLGALTSGRTNNEFFSSRGIRLSDSTSHFHKLNYKKANQLSFNLSFYNDFENISYQFLPRFNKPGDLLKYNEYYFNLFVKQKKIYSSSLSFRFSRIMIDEITEEIKYKREPNFLHSIDKLLKFTSKSDFLIYSPENSYLRNFSDEGQILPLGIKGEGLFKEIKRIFEKSNKSQINQILKELTILDWFDSFSIPTNSFPGEKAFQIKDKYLTETSGFFDQRLANEGFLFLLFYFTLLISEKTPNFFAIDNIDASLNPKLCSELIRRMTKISKLKKKQIIATTHNPFILDGLNLEDDAQRLFVVSRNINGETVVNRIQPKQKLSIPLSEAWMRGYLGGLPNNF